MSSGIIIADRLGFKYLQHRNEYVKTDGRKTFKVRVSLGEWAVSIHVFPLVESEILAAPFTSAKEAMIWQSKLLQGGNSE